MLISDILKLELKKILASNKAEKVETDEFSVSCPLRPEFGDYTTNIAFVLAKQRQQSPFLV
ncbi:MAG: hypothetical protein UX26_C0037G0001, partial [Parcubacteria group bacterium GW2011_GWC1_45_9]